MEVIVTEFPDLCQWFEEPSLEMRMQAVEHDTSFDMAMLNSSATRLENSSCPEDSTDSDQAKVDEPCSQLLTPPSASSCEASSLEEEMEEMQPDPIDSLLHILVNSGPLNSSQEQDLHISKAGYGCGWTGESDSCQLREHCGFVAQLLGLSQLPQEVALPVKPRMQRIMVLRSTPQGLVKVSETHHSFTADQIRAIQQLAPQEQLRCIQSGNLAQYFRPAAADPPVPPPVVTIASAVVAPTGVVVPVVSAAVHRPWAVRQVELDYRGGAVPAGARSRSEEGGSMQPPPTPSPSPPAPDTERDTISGPSRHGTKTCPECDSHFANDKALLKHRRNHHQTYVCKECGEQTVGYYRMAAHTKRAHTKEPMFFCQCGRNFGERKGMTKHRNTCNFLS